MKKHFFYAALLLMGLLAIYSSVVFDSRQILLDDPVVVAPMENVHSLSDYQKLVQGNIIYDVQPVRDLSLWLNSNHTGNLVLWFLTSLLFVACLSSLEVPRNWRYLLGTVFSFSPLFVSTVAWLSARKHLLSLTFTALLTWLLVREVRKKDFAPSWGVSLLIVAIYLLAGFSQPINVLWPFFALLYVLNTHGAKSFRKAPVLFSAVALGASGLLIAILNFRYYGKTYVLLTQGGKYISEEYNSFYWRASAWGRMFFQILFPIETGASDHNPVSWISQAGLILIVLFILVLGKLRVRFASIWAIGAFLAVLPVTVRMTQIFATDNYVIFAAFCIFVIFGLLLKEFDGRMSNKTKKCIQLLFVIVISVYGTRSYVLAKAWNNDFSLWEMSYQVEPTKKSATEYAQMLLTQNQLQKGFEIAMESKKFPGFTKNNNSVIAKAIYVNPDISLEEKYRLLQQDENEWSLYYIAALNAAKGDLPQACVNMGHARKYFSNLSEFNDVVELMAAESLLFCKDSSEIGAKIVADFKSIRGSKWNQSLFEKRAKELGVLK